LFRVRPFHFLFPIHIGEIYFELATTLLNLHFWWPRFDFVVVPVIHCRINLSTSWTWTEIGCLAIRIRARFWFASRYFNSINLQSFNVLNAKQHSKLTHYCVLTNLKRFGESKTSRFQETSVRLLWEPFTVLFTLRKYTRWQTRHDGGQEIKQRSKTSKNSFYVLDIMRTLYFYW